MATVWTIPIDITSRWLDNSEVQTFLASNDLDNAAPDPRVRFAQFADVTKSLERHIGHTFSSVQGAATALFDGIDGGVPVALKLAALRLILKEVYQTRHAPQPFPKRVGEELGTYVYALLDPRNRSVFYVGAGRGTRVYGYVWEALAENEHRQDARGSGDRQRRGEGRDDRPHPRDLRLRPRGRALHRGASDRRHR